MNIYILKFESFDFHCVASSLDEAREKAEEKILREEAEDEEHLTWIFTNQFAGYSVVLASGELLYNCDS